MSTQRLNVSFEYPVVFTRGLFDVSNSLLSETLTTSGDIQRALCFVDEGVATHHPALLDNISTYFTNHLLLELALPPRVVMGGEAIKNDYRLTMEMVDTMLGCNLCRHSYVIAIGGGAVLDAVGFATSIVHRGLRLVRVPTTVLAQNDSGVGVKNGMNLHGGKNTIGTFAPPYAVLNDAAFLSTLSDAAWRDGISEAFKVALIKDASFFTFLSNNADKLYQRDEAAMQTLVERCAALHLDHIQTSGDPFELGTSRPLDFGHWSAHKLESMSNYDISHGAAVAIGVALDTCYAAEQGWLEREQRDQVLQAMQTCGMTLWDDLLEQQLGDGSLAILQGLTDFKEHLGGPLTLTFPNGLGNSIEVHEVDTTCINHCIKHLQTLHPASRPTR